MSLPPPNQPTTKKRSPRVRATQPNSLMSDLALPPSDTTRDSRQAILSPPSQAAQDFQDELLEEQGGAQPKPAPGVLADAISQLQSLRTSAAPSRATSPVASGASSPHAPGVPGVAERIALERQPSVPGTPHFGAQTDLLKQLDQSTKVLRQNSGAPMRAPSVSGIGNVVEKPDMSEAKIVVAMVGLPARGKSYLSNKLMRYLRWLEFNVEVFNVGQLRRSQAKAEFEAGKGKADHSAKYFSHSDEEASKVREKLAEESLESLIRWLKAEGNVGIMDATNSTFDRRRWVRERVDKEPGLQVLFLESYCDDPAIIATNVALKVQSGDPDYKDMTKAEAEADFRKRIAAYESVYQTISEPEISFCRILNVGRQVTINKIEGYLQSRIAFYLMNLHLKPRNIYLSRHGESMYNVGGQIGGDSDLSPQGWKYAQALPALIKENVGEDANLEVWTSTLQRTMQTASYLKFEKKTWKSLDELDAGVCDGMTYEEIEQKYPEDYESRDEDKFNYRYRGGESYRDVVVRLEPVIMELERQRDILIIGHQAILRCLYAYFLALPQQELPYISVPLHTLIKITPMAYGCHEERYTLPIEAVDTHRPKPSKKTGGIPPASADPPRTAASTTRDYFGDTKMFAAKPDTLSEALKDAQGVKPSVLKGQPE